mgnify:CR=1 FL=1
MPDTMLYRTKRLNLLTCQLCYRETACGGPFYGDDGQLMLVACVWCCVEGRIADYLLKQWVTGI